MLAPEVLSLIKNKYSQSSSKTVHIAVFKSPVGDIVAAADNEALYFVKFSDSLCKENFEEIYEDLCCNFVLQVNTVLTNFEAELLSYFNGTLKQFTVPIQFTGNVNFKEIWQKLINVPFGTTKTYGDLAVDAGRTKHHSRYIGTACKNNKHVIVVPCHRILASNPKNGGYNGGVNRKQWLLEHEKKYSK